MVQLSIKAEIMDNDKIFLSTKFFQTSKKSIILKCRGTVSEYLVRYGFVSLCSGGIESGFAIWDGDAGSGQCVDEVWV